MPETVFEILISKDKPFNAESQFGYQSSIPIDSRETGNRKSSGLSMVKSKT